MDRIKYVHKNITTVKTELGFDNNDVLTRYSGMYCSTTKQNMCQGYIVEKAFVLFHKHVINYS